MEPKLVQVYEFTTREEWASYAATNMNKIEAQRKEEHGVEIWLVSKRGVIGKWSEETKRGYIEEYRDAVRLKQDRNER